MPQRFSHALGGAVLALGAPAGWLALRAVEKRRFTFQFLADEVERNPLLVGYLLVATLCVLGLAGYLVGSQADRLVEGGATGSPDGAPQQPVLS